MSKKVTEKSERVDPENYSYVVTWSDEDKAFIAKVVGFPSFAAHGKSQEAALGEVRGVVGSVLEDLASEGVPIPQPIGHRHYSGKLIVRMLSELQGVSLNTFINLKLAS